VSLFLQQMQYHLKVEEVWEDQLSQLAGPYLDLISLENKESQTQIQPDKWALLQLHTRE
jgi:hypothetical protein